MKVAVCTVLAVIVFSFFSCVKNGEEEGPEGAEVSPGNKSGSEQPAEDSPKRTLTLELEQKQDSGGGPDGEEITDSTVPPTFKEKLLRLRGGDPVLPEDFVIGRLQNLESGNRNEQIIVEKAESFGTALTQGKVPEDSVHPEWRDDMKRALWYYHDNNVFPKEIRLGEIIIDGSTARVNVRLLGEKGRAAGELFFEMQGDEWYITDIQADFSKLTQPYRREEQFEPSIYHWLDNS